MVGIYEINQHSQHCIKENRGETIEFKPRIIQIKMFLLNLAGCLTDLRREAEQVQGQVRRISPDVGGEWLDQRPGPLRMVPVVLQVLPGDLDFLALRPVNASYLSMRE